MRSRTLDYLDSGIAHVEGTKDRVGHWFQAHCSWAWRTHAFEESFTFTISITGKLRERARRLALAKIRRTLIADGASGPLVSRDGREWQQNLNGACEDWLADLPQTGKVRTPPFDYGEQQAKHRSVT
jgi:hypothetical protein